MRKLDKPLDDAVQVYRMCIGRVRDGVLKARLEAVEIYIENAAIEFDDAANTATLYALSTQDNVGGVSKEEMEKVYTQRMAKEKAPGRSIYEKLLNSSPHNKCPLCGQGSVSTLDHYLPKLEYPALVVVPVNLVPACSDCNKAKLEHVPQKAEEQTLHPYYDNVEEDTWLSAEVIQNTPAALHFFVNPPVTWDGIKAGRVRHHFKMYKLAKLYASNSGSELVSIRYRLEKLFRLDGAIAVKNYLEEQAATYHAVHLNSWQTAMYRALKDSNWFCEGGFR